ncbi:MAG: amidohydrolase family protein [Planctomycetota bacterium]|jgi:imidazolonepropionase-like amidohydrolase
MIRPSSLLLLALLVSSLPAVPPESVPPGSVHPDAGAAPRTIVPGRVQLADGRLAAGRAVVIGVDGRIERIAAADAPDLPSPILRTGEETVLAPGLHEFLGSLGAPGELEDAVVPFDENATARAVIDPTRRDLAAAHAAGVLHATVAPRERNPLSGRAITFHTGLHGALAEVEPTRPGPLLFAVGETALSATREPTSRAGLRIALERWIRTRGEELLPPTGGGGALAAPLVHCTEAMDIRTALDLLGSTGPTLILASGGAEAAAVLARATGGGWRRPIVVGPFDARTPIPELRGAAALAATGAELIFRGGMPRLGAESLRETARRATAQGLPPAAARRAITSNPARASGLAGTIGSILAGARADLVLLDGDPLLPGTSVLHIFVGGRGTTPHSPTERPQIPTLDHEEEMR